MGYNVPSTNRSVGPEAAVEPYDSQATKSKLGEETTKGVESHEQPGQPSEKNANA